jgi:hypothetical protein
MLVPLMTPISTAESPDADPTDALCLIQSIAFLAKGKARRVVKTSSGAHKLTSPSSQYIYAIICTYFLRQILKIHR